MTSGTGGEGLLSLRKLTTLPGRTVRRVKVASRITAKGQVTIPVAVRRALDLHVGDELIFELDPEAGDARAQVRKAADFLALAGSVPVPAEWSGAEWPNLREAAWSAPAERHHDASD